MRRPGLRRSLRRRRGRKYRRNPDIYRNPWTAEGWEDDESEKDEWAGYGGAAGEELLNYIARVRSDPENQEKWIQLVRAAWDARKLVVIPRTPTGGLPPAVMAKRWWAQALKIPAEVFEPTTDTMWLSPRSLSLTLPEGGSWPLVERSETNPLPGVWLWGRVYVPFSPPQFSSCPRSTDDWVKAGRPPECTGNTPDSCRHGEMILEGFSREEWPHICPENHSRQVGPGSCPKEKVKTWTDLPGGGALPKSWGVCGRDLKLDDLHYWDEISRMFNNFPKIVAPRVTLEGTEIALPSHARLSLPQTLVRDHPHEVPRVLKSGFEVISKTSEDLFLLDFPSIGFEVLGPIIL